MYPFDAVVLAWAVVALNQNSARLFALPSSLGIELRILNGYAYISPNSVTDKTALARRAELFEVRSGYYFDHWDELYERWVEKVETATLELEALAVPELPEYEDESLVTEGRGVGSSYLLLAAYDRLLEGLDRILQLHFELLNLGYGAYQTFGAFLGIEDRTLAMMVAGIDVLVLRPDDELRRLAELALELGIGDLVRGAGVAGRRRGTRAASSSTQRGADQLQTHPPRRPPPLRLRHSQPTAHRAPQRLPSRRRLTRTRPHRIRVAADRAGLCARAAGGQDDLGVHMTACICPALVVLDPTIWP